MNVKISNILILSSVLFFFASPLRADEIRIGYGLEELRYKEKEATFNIDSNASVSNTIFMIQYEGDTVLELPPIDIFWGLKVKFPVTKGDTTEIWHLNGDFYQSNALKYGWLRGDLYAGAPVYDLIKPYIGFRYFNAKQERSKFIVTQGSIPPSDTVIEEIADLGILFGMKGRRGIGNLGLGYHLEYIHLPENKVENTAIPNYDLSGEGYAYELGIESGYRLYKGLHLAIDGYIGRIHWKGSDWEWTECSWDVGGQSWCRWAKWPENTTDYLGGIVSLQYEF